VTTLVEAYFLFVHDTVDEGPVGTRASDPDTVEVPADLELYLARRYRPFLRFDTAERWRPVEVGRFFEESQAGGRYVHRLCDRSVPAQAAGRGCDRVETVDEFEEFFGDKHQRGLNLAVDIAGNKPHGSDFATPDATCLSEGGNLLDCNRGPPSAIYYNVQHVKDGRYYVDYWWFFRYNDFVAFPDAQDCEASARPFCGDHEGDWEGVTAATSPDDFDELEYVAYAAHNGTFRYAPSGLKRKGPYRTRPVVYVANGSHAAYPIPCVESCKQDFKVAGISLPEGGFDGGRGWHRNKGTLCDDDKSEPSNTECLQELPPGPLSGQITWNAFAGHWGKVCSGSLDCPVRRGPLSPGHQPRYKAPWCHHPISPDGEASMESVTCDEETPGEGRETEPGVATKADCQAWAGPLSVVTACDNHLLAAALEDDEDRGKGGIRVEVSERGAARPSSGQSDTPGVAQLLGEPLRPPGNVVVRGRVSEVLVRAQTPSEGSVQAGFTNLSLLPRQKARIEILDDRGKIRFRLFPQSGRKLKPAFVHQEGEPSSGEGGRPEPAHGSGQSLGGGRDRR
jgi:hypothetical protein